MKLLVSKRFTDNTDTITSYWKDDIVFIDNNLLSNLIQFKNELLVVNFSPLSEIVNYDRCKEVENYVASNIRKRFIFIFVPLKFKKTKYIIEPMREDVSINTNLLLAYYDTNYFDVNVMALFSDYFAKEINSADDVYHLGFSELFYYTNLKII